MENQLTYPEEAGSMDGETSSETFNTRRNQEELLLLLTLAVKAYALLSFIYYPKKDTANYVAFEICSIMTVVFQS